MPHQNSVLHGVLKHIPWSVFDKLVEEHQADRRVRRMSTRSQLVALLYGQLAGASSLREIETAAESHAARLYHLGAREVSRSTLADANRLRSHEVFSGLLGAIIPLVGRSLRKEAGEAIRLIDSTTVKLSSLAEWSRFSDKVYGAKAHIVYDPDADRPVYLDVTPQRTHDITAAKKMPIEAKATYVFDMGYYDFGWWAALAAKGCRFVTRLKKHTTLTVTKTRRVLKADRSDILSDVIGLLPQRMARSRKNPFAKPVREVQVRHDNGKVLRILTNDLKSPARQIADLYKRRWAIELFFRWVKQTLKIRHFLGRSENAIRIQIAVALIAYLLLRLASEAAFFCKGPLAFARLVRANLMHCRNIAELSSPPPRSTLKSEPQQLLFCFPA